MDTTDTRPPADGTWSGRTDGAGPAYARWHQTVRLDAEAGTESGTDTDVALVGFVSDEGVRRNQGRTGAAEGPAALRRALAPLALHRKLSIRDAGDVVVDGQALEPGQEALGRTVAHLLDHSGLVVVLGGGHETAYGSYLGRIGSRRTSGQRVGVLNLDAHFDLRVHSEATSGTPFAQMAHDDRAHGRDFVYAVLGVCRDANTPALFQTADELGTRYLLDVECVTTRTSDVIEFVDAFLSDVDTLHLSIDLDVLPAAVAPGVSAPAGYGVPMEVLVAVVERASASGKLALVDVVELSPPYDKDGRTARSAARLISSIVHAHR